MVDSVFSPGYGKSHLRGFGPKKFREGGYGTGYNRPTPYAMLIGFTPGLVSRICIRALPAFKGVHPRDAFTEGRITNPQVPQVGLAVINGRLESAAFRKKRRSKLLLDVPFLGAWE